MFLIVGEERLPAGGVPDTILIHISGHGGRRRVLHLEDAGAAQSKWGIPLLRNAPA
jgi:hypothetical protein